MFWTCFQVVLLTLCTIDTIFQIIYYSNASAMNPKWRNAYMRVLKKRLEDDGITPAHATQQLNLLKNGRSTLTSADYAFFAIRQALILGGIVYAFFTGIAYVNELIDAEND